MASGCDHIEHVRTQIPYAVLVGVVSMLVCAIPVAYGLPWWIALSTSAVLLLTVLLLVGRKTDVRPG
jgi:Na+/H+ antiporter NhaC